MYRHSCRLGNTAHWHFFGSKNLNPAHNLPTLHRLSQFLGISCFDLWNVKKTGMQIGDSSTEWSLTEPKVLKPQELRGYLLCCPSFRRFSTKSINAKQNTYFKTRKKSGARNEEVMKNKNCDDLAAIIDFHGMKPWTSAAPKIWTQNDSLKTLTTWDSHSENLVGRRPRTVYRHILSLLYRNFRTPACPVTTCTLLAGWTHSPCQIHNIFLQILDLWIQILKLPENYWKKLKETDQNDDSRLLLHIYGEMNGQPCLVLHVAATNSRSSAGQKDVPTTQNGYDIVFYINVSKKKSAKPNEIPPKNKRETELAQKCLYWRP